jgi:hypothetical protein
MAIDLPAMSQRDNFHICKDLAYAVLLTTNLSSNGVLFHQWLFSGVDLKRVVCGK